MSHNGQLEDALDMAFETKFEKQLLGILLEVSDPAYCIDVASLLVFIVPGTTMAHHVRVLIEYITGSYFLPSFRTFVQAV